ncbi:MAG TPA: hypothetical protein PK597_05800 [Oscillospiraceae bacterium]|nr:hypothetical protein [Oscillospiraceae bacterium]
MLGKVLRLDLKFGWRKYFALAAVLVAAGLLIPFVFDIAQFGTSIVFMLGLLVVGLLCVVYVVQHYYRNLFGSEGYFMFTLPVESWQLLLSKVLSAVIWFNFMLFSAGVMTALLSRTYIDWGGFFQKLFSSEYLTVLFEMFSTANIIAVPTLLAVYLGLALATFSVRGRQVGIGIGVAASVALSWLSYWTVMKVSNSETVYDLAINAEESFLAAHARLFSAMGVALAFTLVYFLITNYLVRHRLNLK